MKNSSAIPASFASIGTPKFIFGHEVEFPRGPADLLEAWHLVYPSCIPPCSYTISGLPRQQWKVFDRNGNELKYTLFQINSERAPLYRVLVLHDLAGADRLMSCADMGRKRTWKRTFLLAWNGIEKEFDSEVSAVRLIGKTHDGMGFHKNIFRAAPKNPRLRNSSIKRSSMPLTAPGQTRSLRTSRKRHTIKAAPPKETPASEVGSSETSSESDVSEYQKPSLPKKLRISSAPSGPIQTHKIEDVVFKLISEQTDDTRCFPMVECSSGKMLFAKSRKFFRLINPDAKVDILSCRLPFQHERRYLFEGSEGEFSLLLADIQNSKGSQKSPIIEVKCIT